ncbi:MAG: hypothetical protein EOP84_35505 [Verrucomicrobiaceae bacterium]|nr:MAG: hypothetical protein EOP84_35505 [Verrucomicrobiaceae bacterium]
MLMWLLKARVGVYVGQYSRHVREHIRMQVDEGIEKSNKVIA